MSDNLYLGLANVCHKFYKLYFPHQEIAIIIDDYLQKYNCKKIVFIGGLVYVAKILKEKGYEITFVDYTEEMVNEAKKVLKGVSFATSDMKKLSLKEKYDAIILMGRIFTYLYTNKDVSLTLNAFRKNLKKSGIVLIDNYETGKIDKDNYFNGTIELRDKNTTIRRISKMIKKKNLPSLYKWDCIYEEFINGKKESYEDKNHILRGFSREEMKKIIEKNKLRFIENASNFENKSFITLAQK